MSAVGIVRASRNKIALISSLIAKAQSFHASSATCNNTTASSKINNNVNKRYVSKISKPNMSTRGISCAYKTSRPFRRHTALAVEGDALFAELIEYTHDCYY